MVLEKSLCYLSLRLRKTELNFSWNKTKNIQRKNQPVLKYMSTGLVHVRACKYFSGLVLKILLLAPRGEQEATSIT
jgi:hypothetical protein